MQKTGTAKERRFGLRATGIKTETRKVAYLKNHSRVNMASRIEKIRSISNFQRFVTRNALWGTWTWRSILTSSRRKVLSICRRRWQTGRVAITWFTIERLQVFFSRFTCLFLGSRRLFALMYAQSCLITSCRGASLTPTTSASSWDKLKLLQNPPTLFFFFGRSESDTLDSPDPELIARFRPRPVVYFQS